MEFTHKYPNRGRFPSSVGIGSARRLFLKVLQKANCLDREIPEKDTFNLRSRLQILQDLQFSELGWNCSNKASVWGVAIIIVAVVEQNILNFPTSQKSMEHHSQRYQVSDGPNLGWKGSKYSWIIVNPPKMQNNLWVSVQDALGGRRQRYQSFNIGIFAISVGMVPSSWFSKRKLIAP